MVIELDGGVHSRADQKEYDDVRRSVIKANGITLLRIRNQDLEDDLEGVLETIARELG